MKDLKDLVWDLFLKVRELMPASELSTRWQQDWATGFHGLDVAEGRHQAVDTADHDAEADDDEPDADPHEHGVPHRPRSKAKHKR